MWERSTIREDQRLGLRRKQRKGLTDYTAHSRYRSILDQSLAVQPSPQAQAHLDCIDAEMEMSPLGHRLPPFSLLLSLLPLLAQVGREYSELSLDRSSRDVDILEDDLAASSRESPLGHDGVLKDNGDARMRRHVVSELLGEPFLRRERVDKEEGESEEGGGREEEPAERAQDAEGEEGRVIIRAETAVRADGGPLEADSQALEEGGGEGEELVARGRSTGGCWESGGEAAEGAGEGCEVGWMWIARGERLVRAQGGDAEMGIGGVDRGRR